jgi:OPA family glycerol-3-phosphate transporter-like MFS transporter
MTDARTARWQGITLLTLFTGYAGYYLCRSNLSVAGPLLLKEYAADGLDKAGLGAIASVGVLCYSVGKSVNGVLADLLGGRPLFLLGMAASVACTFLFGLSGLGAFTVIWAVNRYVQSMGWGGLVQVAAHWFPAHRMGTVMGILSMSFLLGDACARVYLGWFILAGASWRGVFFAAGGALGGILLVSLFTLKGSPRAVGCEEPADAPDNVYGPAGDDAPEGARRLLGPLLRSPSFWLICLMSAGLTLIRESFNLWTPTYLTEAAGLDAGTAAWDSMVFPLVGAAGAVFAGVLADLMQRRHDVIMVPSLLLLAGVLGLMSVVPVAGNRPFALLLIGSVSFFLLAPYSFLAGALAVGLGGKRGSSTAAGLIDSAGYLGGVLSGYGVGAVAQYRGWPAVFSVLAGTAVVTAVVAVAYGVLHASRVASPMSIPAQALDPRPAAAPSTGITTDRTGVTEGPAGPDE